MKVVKEEEAKTRTLVPTKYQFDTLMIYAQFRSVFQIRCSCTYPHSSHGVSVWLPDAFERTHHHSAREILKPCIQLQGEG